MIIKEAAEKAGVSIATVSRVINNSGYVKEETRKTVMEALKQLNFTPKVKTAAREKSNRIGVVIPDITNPFFGEVIKGINRVADSEKLNFILCDTDENIEKEIRYLEMLKEQNIRGLIITPTTNENIFNRKYLEQLNSMGVPVVLLDRDVSLSHYDAVFIDNIKGSYEAVEVLIREGHEKIAIIAGPTTSRPGRDRLKGYYKALGMNNIPEEEKYIFYGDFKLESGYSLTNKILSMKDPPTAIFVSNNMMTLGCIKALREKNLSTPEDIAIVAFDEIDAFNIFSLNISYVSRPTVQMGEAAMGILMERMKENAPESISVKEIILSPTVVLKGSEKLKKNTDLGVNA